ncbi:hypothetical protein KAT92_02820, partial [Candidatus Babeliales bacterium]|nr:hypothetical protein [Candidatus Babeliales bacterium]
MTINRFLKALLLSILLFSLSQQASALDQSRITKFACSSFASVLSLRLMWYCGSKIDDIKNLLEDLEEEVENGSDEAVEQKTSFESQIKKYKIAKYLSFAAAIVGGVYAGKQAWELGQDVFDRVRNDS